MTRGYTLISVMMIVTIIGIVCGIVIPIAISCVVK